MIQKDLEQWKQWLDPQAQIEFAKQGFYSMPLKLNDGNLVPNSRVICVNTEAAYYENIYNVGTHYDATGVLNWLEITLSEMEKNGEKAIIAGHVPPSHTTLNDFGLRF